MRRTQIMVTAAATVILLSTVAAAEFTLNVQEHKLENGLTILLLENHATPSVSYYTFFKAGTRCEHPGIIGISHFFEHMMFNGAKRYGPKQFDLVLESNGGSSNAYTTQDITVYYEDFPADILELVVDLEADRLANLAFAPEVLESERGVVKEERRLRVDNNYSNALYESFMQTAFPTHPYGWPVAGIMDDLNRISRQDCLDYHRTYYAPNNAVVVLVGDFQPQQALALIDKYYREIPAGPPPTANPQSEPAQTEPRRISMTRPVQFTHFIRGYRVGDQDSPDLYALEIIENILAEGESSRLYQSLINDQQIAIYTSGSFGWHFDPWILYFYIAATPGVGDTAIAQAFDSIVTAFIIDGATDREVTKAQNRLIAGFYRNFETCNGSANQIGYYQTLFGDWSAMYRYVDQIGKVTPAQIKEVAARYFTPANSTTAIMLPEGDSQ